MTLSTDEAIARINKPFNGSAIALSIYQQERLLMHCEPTLEKYNLPSGAWRDYTMWWKSLITAEKHQRVEELMRTPLSTCSITKDIFDQISKFTNAQDRVVSFNFLNPDHTNDYNEFLEKTKDEAFWMQKCPEEMRSGIGSVLVVDLPAIQSTERPEPYKYFIDPRNFVDLQINKFNGRVEYFIFKQDDYIWDNMNTYYNPQSMFALLNSGYQNKDKLQRVIVIDDKSYRVFLRKEGSEWVVASESEHNLDYCPCIDFWQPSLKGTNGINKIGVITHVLDKLDFYLFFKALATYMDMYASFPILAMYSEQEEEFDDKTKDFNNGNYFTSSTTNPISTTNQVANPRTTKRKYIGAGSTAEVPIPSDNSDVDFMKDGSPMKWIEMNVENIKHVKERVDELRDEIIEICTGEDSDRLNEMVKNTEMLFSEFNAQESILNLCKRQVERVHKFWVDTSCILRYGKDYYLGCTIDYGSDWFLKDATTLTREFETAVKSGMPQSYTNQIAISAIKTRFKNNGDVLERQRILSDLEPYLNMNWTDIQLLGIDKLDILNFKIKANFSTFVNRFELENGNIVKFGSALDYSEKISRIKQTFIDYANGIKWTEPISGTVSPNGTEG